MYASQFKTPYFYDLTNWFTARPAYNTEALHGSYSKASNSPKSTGKNKTDSETFLEIADLKIQSTEFTHLFPLFQLILKRIVDSYLSVALRTGVTRAVDFKNLQWNVKFSKEKFRQLQAITRIFLKYVTLYE